MAWGKSTKMYLTIFVATTCIYMVLYQYSMSRTPELIKTPQEQQQQLLQQQEQEKPSYASYLWSTMSIVTSAGFQQKIQQDNNNKIKTTTTSTTSSSPSTTTLLSSSSVVTTTTKAPSSSIALPVVNNETNNQQNNIGKSRKLLTSSSSSSSFNISTQTSSTTSTSTTTSSASATSPSSASSSATSSSSSSSSCMCIRSPTSSAPVNRHRSEIFTPVSDPPPLYIITPTYKRPEQLAELTRLGYTLKHVVNLLWLVIEDANTTSELVTQTLNRIGVPYEYLVAPMPEKYKKGKKAKPRGVSNRNRGLEYLRANASEGVFYFADDDNTYDINIFEQMRYTKMVSMWPVGLVTKFGVSSPIVRKGKLDGYYDGWIGGRKYPVDMAGFAVSVKFLHARPHAIMPFKPGYEEDGFLKSLAPLLNTEIELLASECTEILTWHTQTKKNQPADALNMTKYGDTNLVSINELLVRR